MGQTKLVTSRVCPPGPLSVKDMEQTIAADDEAEESKLIGL